MLLSSALQVLIMLGNIPKQWPSLGTTAETGAALIFQQVKGRERRNICVKESCEICIEEGDTYI